MPDPIYTVGNCRVAYQLHWSLTFFAQTALPSRQSWWHDLSAVVEIDGVRLLEYHQSNEAMGQFFVSTRPAVSPAAVVRAVKGRLQYLLRGGIPQLWRRNYAIVSVGSANNDALQNYVNCQVERHPPADPRVADRLAQAQFHDPNVDLAELRSSSHGRFIHSLQIVIENADHLTDVREDWLTTTRTMLIAVCKKKQWLLSRLGIVGNHFHVLIGCDVADVPENVALSVMNNLAYAHDMKRVFENSYYVGTFGAYDHHAIRRKVADQ